MVSSSQSFNTGEARLSRSHLFVDAAGGIEAEVVIAFVLSDQV